MVTIIVAMDESMLIGQNSSNNGMPWNLPEDLRHFKNTTTGKTIVMGSTTYKAIGRPLPNRKTIVLSKKGLDDDRVEVRSSLSEVIEEYQKKGEDLFIAGGASIYKQALPLADEMLVSKVPGTHKGETYFPNFSQENFILKEAIPFETFTLEHFIRKK